MEIMREANVVKIVFMRISFLAWDMLTNFHDSILLTDLVIMVLKFVVDLLSTFIRQPRYVSILFLLCLRHPVGFSLNK